MMLSALHADERWCHVDSSTRLLVDAAVAGNLVRLGAAPQTELEAAIASLDLCSQDDCRLHGKEREARQRLDAALDELLSVDETDGPDVGCGGCEQCGRL